VRYPQGRRAQTRARIVECAARRFRQDGYAAASVGEIMGDAGLTVGGFYAHFASKEDLFAEALGVAGAQALADRDPGPDVPAGRWVPEFVARYLTAAHVQERADGCPLTALGAEVARAGEGPRAAYRDATECFVSTLAAHLPGPHASSTARSIAAMCVGALTLARGGMSEAEAAVLFADCARSVAELIGE
jgi:TetR/AcrR family transcriptional repressor of nem operon